MLTNEQIDTMEAGREMDETVEVICLHCAKIFRPKPGSKHNLKTGKRQGLYCSISCYNMFRRERAGITGLTNTVCRNCGTTFKKKTSQLKHRRNHYCSQDCFQEYVPKDAIRAARSSVAASREAGEFGSSSRLIYTSALTRRFIEWDGDTCAFPGCQNELSKRHPSKMHLCATHCRRYAAAKHSRNRRYQRRLNELT